MARKFKLKMMAEMQQVKHLFGEGKKNEKRLFMRKNCPFQRAKRHFLAKFFRSLS